MKYILNKLESKTTNGFNVNSLNIDLDLPKMDKFKDYKISNCENIKIEASKSNKFTSDIGLSFDKSLNLNITVSEKCDKPICFTYEFSNNDVLINEINLNLLENSNSNIIFKYTSLDDNIHFNHLKLNIFSKTNSVSNITVINLLNNKSVNLIAVNCNVEDKAILNNNLIDLGGNVKVSNYKSITSKEASSALNALYYGSNKNIIDMNFNYINNGISSINNIEVQGALNAFAKKIFRGTIDFKPNTKKSIGMENENCILLSDECISRSVPILLCGEEDVEGAHSVSSGKIDNNKLFYLESRGINKSEAIKLIILSNFNKIIEKIDDVNTEEEIKLYLDKIL